MQLQVFFTEHLWATASVFIFSKKGRIILCFHYIESLFGSFRNDPLYFAVQQKQKCCQIDPDVTCFHLEQQDKKIKIVCRFMLKVKTWPNMKLIEKYIKLRRIVKKLGLKKIKTKNILADCRKLKYQEKVLQNFSRLTMISSY